MRLLSTFLVMLVFFGLISYGQDSAVALKSGLEVGENCPAFDPTHISGPNRGTQTCPMCAYGREQGVIIWLNNDDFGKLATLAERLEDESQKRGLRQFRVFIMYMNPHGKPKEEVERMLLNVANKASLKNVALTYVPGPEDPETSATYRINPSPDVRNTMMVYRSRKVVEKQVNVEPTQANLARLIAVLDRPAVSNQ